MFMNMCSTSVSVCGIIGSFLYDFYFFLVVQHVAGSLMLLLFGQYAVLLLISPAKFFCPFFFFK